MIDVEGRSNAALDGESQVHGAVCAVERLGESGGEVDDEREGDEKEAHVGDRLSHGNTRDERSSEGAARKASSRCYRGRDLGMGGEKIGMIR
jgi:hypothetical protein